MHLNFRLLVKKSQTLETYNSYSTVVCSMITLSSNIATIYVDIVMVKTKIHFFPSPSNIYYYILVATTKQQHAGSVALHAHCTGRTDEGKYIKVEKNFFYSSWC